MPALPVGIEAYEVRESRVRVRQRQRDISRQALAGNSGPQICTVSTNPEEPSTSSECPFKFNMMHTHFFTV